MILILRRIRNEENALIVALSLLLFISSCGVKTVKNHRLMVMVLIAMGI